MLLAHAGEDHSSPTATTETQESTGQVLAANDASSNGINPVLIGGGIILLLVAAFVAYKFILKRKPAAETASDS